MIGILGKKVGMTSVFDAEGNMVPVTVVQAGPIFVTQIKTVANDGYTAVQVGFENIKESRINKPEQGHLKKAGVEFKKHLVEFKVSNAEEFTLGQQINVEMFADVKMVDVTGTSKGKGTAGTVKRWNQKEGPKTHGSKFHRAPGSLGANSTPARVVKGQTMAGRLGNEQVTVQNLELVRVDADRNLLLIKGAIPGPKNSLVTVKSAVKAR
jgi:large subunit ribosomal protein L3